MKNKDELRRQLDNGPHLRVITPNTKAYPDTAAERISQDQAPAPKWSTIDYGAEPEIKGRDYLIKGLVDRGAFSVWYGPPKSGKSFALMDAALHIASGRSWRGHRVKAGRVLYISAEGGGGIVHRMVAARRKFGTDKLPFHVLPVPLDLLNGDAEHLLTFITAKAQESGIEPAAPSPADDGAKVPVFDLIVLDTLARAMPGGDESASAAMTAVVGALDRIRAETGAHIAVVHHCGLSRSGPRGHSSLPAAYDLGVEIKDGTMKVTENREGLAGQSWSFALDVVEIGTDQDGDLITSCIIRETEDRPETKAAAPPPRPLGAVEKVTLDCVKAALADHGQEAVAAGAVARDIPPRATVVRRSLVDESAARYMPDRPGNKRREALDRALISLQSKGLLFHADGWCWIPSHVA